MVQQGGRLDEYLLETVRDGGIDIDPELVKNAGNAVCKKVYRLFRERGIPAKVMPAGLRAVYHLTSMAGADMTFSPGPGPENGHRCRPAPRLPYR